MGIFSNKNKGQGKKPLPPINPEENENGHGPVENSDKEVESVEDQIEKIKKRLEDETIPKRKRLNLINKLKMLENENEGGSASNSQGQAGDEE